MYFIYVNIKIMTFYGEKSDLANCTYPDTARHFTDRLLNKKNKYIN